MELIIFFVNIFSRRCDPQNAQNFTEYKTVLKIARNISKFGLLDIIYNALFKFLRRPHLFNRENNELFEVDSLHQDLYKRNRDRLYEPRLDAR